jgi:hypothetical protein
VADEESDLLSRLKSLRRDFGRLRKHVGTPAAIVVGLAIGIGALWWFWDDLAKKPGVEQVVAWIERASIDPAKPGHITIALAHLVDDKDREHEKFLRDALAHEFDGADTKLIDRMIALPDTARTDQESEAHAREEANRLRERAGADVLLWGNVITLDRRSAMRLYWTTGNELTAPKSSGLYSASAETIALPPLFWDDLKQVLGVLVQSRIAAITDKLTGHYYADRIE